MINIMQILEMALREVLNLNEVQLLIYEKLILLTITKPYKSQQNSKLI
jgi:hypothetical protein